MEISKNENMESSKESIAIIGIGCRFPGGICDPASFWEFIKNKRDGITNIPNDRWNHSKFFQKKPIAKDKIYIDKGGFLEGIDRFDPFFFDISTKEANHMDPQQRILLEVTWEALEDAGIIPESLSGSETGVYIGSFVHDYENVHSNYNERKNYGAYSAVGISSSIIANRISHCMNFRGPSIVSDTACSSSLVSIHLACSDLIQRNTSIGIAGGINLIFKPEMTMILCNASMLSPDGYCKSFDHKANGYVRSEGAGIVILKRLSEAMEDKDPIYCVIKGSALNQDGATSTLTTPNKASQIRLIQKTLEKARCDPGEIQYVEAHGTGTEVGDPIEAGAIGNALACRSTEECRCYVGSVKSNFGHTESAAGVAGIIKTALMLQKKQIPPNLHFNVPNPNIDFSALGIAVPTSLKKWKTSPGKIRKAGVNSFGFGGTNAHAILEEIPTSTGMSNDKNENNFLKEKKYLIPITAKTNTSLSNLIKSWVCYLNKHPDPSPSGLHNIALSAALRKTHHPFRITIKASSLFEANERLAQQAKKNNATAILNAPINQNSSENVTFVFSGMGQQWAGMGKQLFEQVPTAKAEFEKSHAIFKELTNEWSLIDELACINKAESRLHETKIAQPCIFAIQIALAKTWIKWGINPGRVVGHSVGEIAASYIAGIYSLKEACKLVFHRSRLQHRMFGKGKMLAVGLSQEAYQEFDDHEISSIVVAAINSS